jgi:hypothetical protein
LKKHPQKDERNEDQDVGPGNGGNTQDYTAEKPVKSFGFFACPQKKIYQQQIKKNHKRGDKQMSIIENQHGVKAGYDPGNDGHGSVEQPFGYKKYQNTTEGAQEDLKKPGKNQIVSEDLVYQCQKIGVKGGAEKGFGPRPIAGGYLSSPGVMVKFVQSQNIKEGQRGFYLKQINDPCQEG